MTRWLVASLFAICLVTGTAVQADMRALIALNVNADGALAETLAGQEALLKRHGFGDVQVMTDVTPDEVFKHMKKFLERPAMPEDRRLVWISGLSGRMSQGLCPKLEEGRKRPKVRPTGQSIVLAPDCLARTLVLPRQALHIEKSTPTAARIRRYFRRQWNEGGGGHRQPALAVIPLPAHSAVGLARGDLAVFNVLTGAQGVALRPLAFLSALRRQFPPGSGPFVPTLDLAAWRQPFQQTLHFLNAAQSRNPRG